MVLKDIVKITKESTVAIEITETKENDTRIINFIITVNHLPKVYDNVRKNTVYILSSAFVHILKGTFKIEGNDESAITLKVKI
jgi:hypothetical protein